MRLHRTSFVAVAALVLIGTPGPTAAAPSAIDTRGHRRQRRPLLLPQQAERARRRGQPGRHRRSSPPAPTTTSTWSAATPATRSPARSPRASACRASSSRSTAAPRWIAADLHRLLGPQRELPAVAAGDRRRAACPTVGADRHAAVVLRERAWSPTATPSWPSGRCPTPTARSRGPTASGCTTRTSPRRSRATAGFRGVAAIAVSRTDDVDAARPAINDGLDADR